MQSPQQKTALRGLVTKLSLLVVAMFGFGYLLVPLYSVFCEVTGLNGKTGRISHAQAAATPVDEQRLVTVEFVTSVGAGFPWAFKPMVTRVAVHPGQETEVLFEAVNRGTDTIIGQAVPSVSPNEAARFFSKTECFCFTQQTLAGGESKRMPVRFVVNPKLPANIHTLTLGYTFFRSTVQVSATTSPVGVAEPRS